jgi:hypothetical protein
MNIEQNDLKSSFEAIRSLKMEKIINKITRKDNSLTGIEKPWSMQNAQDAVELYKNYLWIVLKYKNQFPFIPPSKEIDYIWHAHILDTKKYHQDCIDIFGTYLHHDPYFGLNGLQDEQKLHDSFAITQNLHFKEFGEYIYEITDEEEINEVSTNHSTP